MKELTGRAYPPGFGFEAFSPVDRFCSPERQIEMLRLLMRFIELSRRALHEGATPEQLSALPIMRRLQRMSEDFGEEDIDRLKALGPELENEMAALGQGESDAR